MSQAKISRDLFVIVRDHEQRLAALEQQTGARQEAGAKPGQPDPRRISPPAAASAPAEDLCECKHRHSESPGWCGCGCLEFRPAAKPGGDNKPKDASLGCDWEVDIFQRRVYFADNSTQRNSLVRDRDQRMRRALIARVRSKVARRRLVAGDNFLHIDQVLAILDEEAGK